MRNLTKDATLTYDEKLERKEEEKQSSWLDSNARLPDQLASEPPAEQQPLPLSSSDILLNHFLHCVFFHFIAKILCGKLLYL